jgi:type IV pilus assembly protein PilQ
MKQQILTYIFLIAPLVLWAQPNEVDLGNLDLSDVVVIEDVPSPAPLPGDISLPDLGSTVVEIPDAAIDGASFDQNAPEIPVVSVALPSETEVVLGLPGQEAVVNAAASTASEETISVDFPDEDVRTILRNVADLFDLNLVIPDTLQGRTSIKLRNVTWRQVFEVVLDPLGFTYIEDRNILRIKSIAELTSEPVDTRIFIVNYATAEALKGSIAPLVDIAAGGRVQVDVRSNALVVTERPSRMNKIQEIIERLDKPTAQVMIESKFIEVTNTDIQNIGVNWASLSSYSVSAGPYQREWTRSRSSEAGNDAGGLAPVGETLSSLASTARMDTALFSADQFEVILSALNTQDDIRLVSNPTVVTLNNTRAKIAIGERYPIAQYTFNAETGQRQLDGISYEDIGINLDVTPQVNSAGFINLQIIPEVSSSDRFALIETTQVPIIESRRTETTIMIKDGYTLAIGGLVENSTADRGSKVPILGNLPGVGRFFSSESDEYSQRNLIIFITAKTLNPDGSTYLDIIDPRVLDEMGVVPSEVPGYQVPQDTRNEFDKLRELREEAERSEDMNRLSLQIGQIEAAKQQKLQALEYAKMQQDAENTKATSRSNSRIR